MELGRVTVDTDQMAVLKDGQPLQLSQREYDLIRFLAAQPGQGVFTGGPDGACVGL